MASPLDSELSHVQTRRSSSSSTQASTGESSIEPPRKRTKLSEPAPKSSLSFIKQAPLVYPKSCYIGWQAPLEATSEHRAISDLKGDPEDGCVKLILSDFRVYQPRHERKLGDRSLQMISLEFLLKTGVSTLLFDGMISSEKGTRYVESVPFEIVTLEGYGDPRKATVTDEVCLQSCRLRSTNVWYQLGQPAEEYRRFHLNFLWVADLAKHFVDYMCDISGVTLWQFQHLFVKWLHNRYPGSQQVKHWLSACGFVDFRSAVIAHIDFLWKECTDINPSTREQPIWQTVLHMKAIPQQPNIEIGTVVTPFVHLCFKHMYFAKHLLPRAPSSSDSLNSVLSQTNTRRKLLGFWSYEVDFEMATEALRSDQGEALHRCQQNGKRSRLANSSVKSGKTRLRSVDDNELMNEAMGGQTNTDTQNIRVGDVVAIPRDEKSVWKDEASLWYAYVQGTSISKRGEMLLSVIWLYRSGDTTMGNMSYPMSRELFFSNHCNCESGEFLARDVSHKVNIQWATNDPGPPGKEFDFFVRQRYLWESDSFVSLKKTDFACKCNELSTDIERLQHEGYEAGDTVLVQRNRRDAFLEPAVIVEFLLEREEIVFRRLPRRKRDMEPAGTARPNELVWTQMRYSLPASRTKRKCHIIFWDTNDLKSLPTPYDRDGRADLFFITHELLNGHLSPLFEPFPISMNQGFDPGNLPIAKLPTMDLFSGGGSFGRGVEESGATQNLWAIDIDANAMHTYQANLSVRSARDGKLFLGSVDDYLAQALAGNRHRSRYIARIGDVELILAGSPCIGFSRMQPDKCSDSSLKNASLVASVVSFIDHYRPQYALIENVTTMTASIGKEKQNVFSQIICSLVGMGYQVQQFNLDAWSFGDPQSRSRLFIAITAPGLEPLPYPPLSHSHPSKKGLNSSLGTAVNGEHFGKRKFDITPFSYVSAKEACADLPTIDDGDIYRQLMRMIPQVPVEQSYVKAAKAGLISQPQIDQMETLGKQKRKDSSRSYSRVDPDSLMGTIVTRPSIGDAFSGPWMHWEEPRMLTVMEARRAQGLPDNEVLIGKGPAGQWKLIGNGVSRGMSLALGMAIRKALLKNPTSGEERYTNGQTGMVD